MSVQKARTPPFSVHTHCTLSVSIYTVRDQVVVLWLGNLHAVIVGTITISGNLTYDSDQLTLTCISTGGPATTVSWTRDSVNVGEGTETVLNDPEPAQYTHTLTISLGGEYTCTVANNKPSEDSASITVEGILH